MGLIGWHRLARLIGDRARATEMADAAYARGYVAGYAAGRRVTRQVGAEAASAPPAVRDGTVTWPGERDQTEC